MADEPKITEEAATGAFEAYRAHQDASYWNGWDCHCGAGLESAEQLHKHIATAIVAAALPHLQCSCPHISEVDDYCPQHGRDS